PAGIPTTVRVVLHGQSPILLFHLVVGTCWSKFETGHSLCNLGRVRMPGGCDLAPEVIEHAVNLLRLRGHKVLPIPVIAFQWIGVRNIVGPMAAGDDADT